MIVDIERKATGEKVTVSAESLHRFARANGVRVPTEEDFEDNASDWLEAPALKELAGDLIEQYDELGHVLQFKVRYAWKREGGPDGEAGKCKKLGKEARFIAGGVDFFIWVAADRARNMAARQIKALVYHELTHISVDEKERAAIRKHDVELFHDELRRYGPWNPDLAHTAQVFKQLPIEF